MNLQVVEEGAWAEGVSAALSRLGVHVLDSSVLSLADMGCARSLVNAATGSGVLTAISNAARGDLGRVGRNLIADGASSADRQQLRTFLLQVQFPCLVHHMPSACIRIRTAPRSLITHQNCCSIVSGMTCKT